jgi:hypothetical protein
MPLEQTDVPVFASAREQDAFDLRPRDVPCVGNPPFGMAAFAPEIETAIVTPSELHANLEKPTNRGRRLANTELDRCIAAEPSASHVSVVNVLLETIVG